MIVLGIDPGTAALGYGIVERTGGRLRAVDFGCVVTSPDSELPERLRHIHEVVSELIETVGLRAFVAECDRLATAYGPRFQVPVSLRDRAAKNDLFYPAASATKRRSAA